MELLERPHPTEWAHTVRDVAGHAASQAAQVAHKASDKAGDLIDPIVDPLFGARHKRSFWGDIVRTAQRHPWALAASVAVLIGIVFMATRDARSSYGVDASSEPGDSRFRSAA